MYGSLVTVGGHSEVEGSQAKKVDNTSLCFSRTQSAFVHSSTAGYENFNLFPILRKRVGSLLAAVGDDARATHQGTELRYNQTPTRECCWTTRFIFLRPVCCL